MTAAPATLNWLLIAALLVASLSFPPSAISQSSEPPAQDSPSASAAREQESSPTSPSPPLLSPQDSSSTPPSPPAGSQTPDPSHAQPHTLTATARVADLLKQLKSTEDPSAQNVIEELSTAISTDDDLGFLSSEYFTSRGSYRRRLANLINRLVQGNYPSHLINRLGDQSVDSILSAPKSVVAAHEELVQDCERFAQVPHRDRDARKAFLLKLQPFSDILSRADHEYILRQLEELHLDDKALSYLRANAWLMLGFNYHYFFGLSYHAKVLDCLTKTLMIDPRMSKDPILIEVAQKSLAFEDKNFRKLFGKAGGKLPSSAQKK